MNAKAFTLVEVMVAVVIIGILSALAFPVYQKARVDTARTSAINDARQLTSAAQQYFLDRSMTIVSLVSLTGNSGYIAKLSGRNSISVVDLQSGGMFTFEIGNPFLTAGGLTFNGEGRLIGDPY